MESDAARMGRCPKCGTESLPDGPGNAWSCGHFPDVWNMVESGDLASAVDGIPVVRLGRDWSSFDGNDDWDLGTWEKKGFKRFFGDAAVGNPFFEVLIREPSRSESSDEWEDNCTELAVLCPTFLRRPVVFYGQGVYASY